MPILSKVQRGQPITAELFNNMIDAIRECQLQSVVGGTFKRTVSGTTIAFQSQTQQPVGAQDQYPFQFYTGGTVSSPWWGLRAGHVNGVIPSNYATTFSYSVSSSFFINLECTSDGKVVQEVVIGTSEEPPTPTTPTLDFAPSDFKINCYVYSGGSVYRTIGYSSIMAFPQECVREDKDIIAFGQLPYNTYYTWVFAS